MHPLENFMKEIFEYQENVKTHMEYQENVKTHMVYSGYD